MREGAFARRCQPQRGRGLRGCGLTASGLSLHAYTSASASVRRPSASVLPTCHGRTTTRVTRSTRKEEQAGGMQGSSATPLNATSDRQENSKQQTGQGEAKN